MGPYSCFSNLIANALTCKSFISLIIFLCAITGVYQGWQLVPEHTFLFSDPTLFYSCLSLHKTTW